MTYIKPSFFIIGERKCGTSSLYRYLIAHPNVLPCALKEPNFFGNGAAYVHQNIEKYWALFPQKNKNESIKFSWPELNQAGILYHEDVIIKRNETRDYITGEASANTFYEVNPQLIHRYLPNIKLIILFRNPVERAFSHHRMYQRFQAEGRDLGFKVNDFETDMLAELKLIKQGGEGHYLSPGIYLTQLEKWMDTFGKEQIRVYFAEDLGEKTKAIEIMEDIQTYLELPKFNFGKIAEKRFNVSPKGRMPLAVHERLKIFFKEPNNYLSAYLRRELPIQFKTY